MAIGYSYFEKDTRTSEQRTKDTLAKATYPILWIYKLGDKFGGIKAA